MQRRFIDRALDLVECGDDDEPSSFCWTVEATSVLLRWLGSAADEDIKRFLAAERNDRIEVTAMLGNLTPLYDRAEMLESLRPIRRLREEYGISITYAMNCDVNGLNWPTVDLLLDAGIEGFSMAVNDHFGGSRFIRPHLFEWEGPSGRTLSVYDGFHYSFGYWNGIGRDMEEFRETRWPRLQSHLDEIGYPISSIMIQSFHPFGDNGGPDSGFSSFAREWDQQSAVDSGDLPEIHVATAREWWNAVENEDTDLPVHRGDWTDFWNFGAGSSAREVGISRESRRRLREADSLEACLEAIGVGRQNRSPARRSGAKDRAQGWWDVQFFDEHTWGADESVSEPYAMDTAAQRHHKANYAYDARSRSLMLR